MISGPIIAADELLSLHTDLVVLDARAGLDAAGDYLASHLRGAVRADLEHDLADLTDDPIRGGRHPLPSLRSWCQRLGSWGVAPTTAVAIYDAAGGGMAAARAWWMIQAVGHERVAVVDGGWDALVQAGAPTESGSVRPRACGPYPCSTPAWPVVDAETVDRARLDPAWCVIDARAPERYRGETEPLDPTAGHIPGALNVYWRSQLLSDDRFAERDELRARYDAIMRGATPDHVICYCGSGVTACHALLGLHAAGHRGARLYPGSWSEWCRQDRPVARGAEDAISTG